MSRRSFPQRALAAALAAALVVPASGAPAVAAAGGVPRLFMVHLQPAGTVPSRLVRRVSDQLRAELGTSQTLELMPPEEAATDVAPDATAVDLREDARGALAQGRRALKRRAYAEAVEHLQRAITAFDESAAVLERVDEVAAAYQLLGLAEASRGQRQQAVQALATALALDPRAGRGRQPRKLRRVWAAARRALNRPPGGVTVTSRPAGVELLVDGRPYGRTPAVVELVPGIHYLRAEKKGFVPAGVRVELRSGASETVALRLRAPTVAAAGGGDALRAAFHGEIIKRLRSGVVDARMKEVARRLATRATAAYLLFGCLTRRGDGYALRPFLYSRPRDQLVELGGTTFDAEVVNLAAGVYRVAEQVSHATRRFPADREITRVLLGAAVEDGTPNPAATPVAVTGEEGPAIDISRPFWRSWWFWTIIGAALAGGGGAATYFLLQPQHDGLHGGPVVVR